MPDPCDPFDDPFESTHPLFQRFLQGSEPARQAVARWLKAEGHIIQTPPLQVAPSHGAWREYADNGDIWMDDMKRVEVKGTTYDFTCPWDWPFRHAAAARQYVVMSPHAFDAPPKPYMVITVAPDLYHAAYVMGRDSNKWFIGTLPDRRFGPDYKQVKYFSPLSLVRFFELDDRKERAMKQDLVIAAMRKLDPNWSPSVVDTIAQQMAGVPVDQLLGEIDAMLHELQVGGARFDIEVEKRRIEDRLTTDQRAREALERPERFAGEHDAARAWLRRSRTAHGFQPPKGEK